MASQSSRPTSSSSSYFSSSVPMTGSDLDQSPNQRYNLYAPQQPPQRGAPPRLPSPRYFRDFFSSGPDAATRRQATLPRASFQDTMQDVRSAIQRANRALENAQEAFSSRGRTPRSEVVDLTGSPPDRSQSRFIAGTTHPHDSNTRLALRRMNTLHEPVYGSRTAFTPIPENDPSDSSARARIRRTHNSYAPYFNPFPLPGLNADLQDEAAVQRQRDNHQTWLQTQARAREFQNAQRQRTSPTAPSPSSSPSPTHSNQPRQRSPSRSSSSESDMSSVEAVDLTTVQDNAALNEALSKQQADAVASQKSRGADSESGRSILTSYKCPICMETPVDITATICGHLFCHRCIVDTLKWSARQRRVGARKSSGVCPVCRKAMSIKDSPGQGRTLVPLELKFLTKKRKRDDKGKQKVYELSEDEAQGSNVREKENGRKTGKLRKREEADDVDWDQFINQAA